jgi:chromosome condensin MukBEF complex kleisin-like MukF subunit
MSKIAIDEVEAILLENKIDKNKVQSIIQDLEKVVEELKNDKEVTPKSKWEHVIVLYDKDGVLKDKEIAGWVVQQKEGEDVGTILSKLSDAAKAQNEVTKKKKNIIDDIVGLFEHLKSKWAKEKNLRVKTKELTRVLVTDGKLV